MPRDPRSISIAKTGAQPVSLLLHDKSLLVSRCYIGGVFMGDPTHEVRNPATGETITSVPNLSADETVYAVEAASEAFGSWAAMTAKERAKILRRWFDLIIAAREDLAIIMTAEQGKPFAEAVGEIDYAAAYIEFYAEEAKRVAGESLPSHRSDARILVQRQPVGVVAAITPWNFPAAMITRKVGPALAAGCTTIVKPAPETPLTALALAVLAERAGLPAGVLNVVTGDASQIGPVLTSHPDIRLLTFTGSTATGKKIAAQCTTTVKRVALELGGNAPFIIFEDADLEAAVQGVMASKFRNMGQTCVCANRIYVHKNRHDDFVAMLDVAVSKLVVGNGMQGDVTQGPLISEAAIEKVEAHISDALSKGAKLHRGGKRHALGRTFFEPTILTGMTQKMIVAREETFGPVAPVFTFETEEEVIQKANDTEYGLAAYVYSKDVGCIFRMGEALQYGILGINSGLISTELAPFGGMKESGYGREGGHVGIEEFLDIKYMLLAGLNKA